jgi:hypothetical protein
MLGTAMDGWMDGWMDWLKQYVPPERCYLPTSTNGVTAQNANKDIWGEAVLVYNGIEGS